MIDASALVSKDARIADDVRIDAFAIVEADVSIGGGTWIGSHSVIRSGTSIGERNQIHEHVALGGAPQSNNYRGGPTVLEIGNDNIIREFATMHRGTEAGGGVTRVGSDNFFMVSTHVAHDCQIGDHVTFANGSSIAGHVIVDDYAFFGGFTLVHQNCRVGKHCMAGINSVCRQDIPPFVLVEGNPASAKCINSRGLSARGFSKGSISNLSHAYRMIFRNNGDRSLDDCENELAKANRICPEVKELIAFLRSSERGYIQRIATNGPLE